MSNSEQKYSLKDFIAELERFPEPTFRETGHVLQFLTACRVDAATLQPYLFWDNQHYTRNLIHKTSSYELIAICWDIGQASAIHNHQDENCWMAVPIGKLVVQNYRVLYQNVGAGKCRLEKAERVEMSPEQPQAVYPDAPVHKVFNPREFKDRAVSLHIYAHPFDTCVVYSEENQTCGKVKLAYSSRYGKREEGVPKQTLI